MRKPLLQPALPDQDMGEGMLRPGVSRLDAQRALGAGLGRGNEAIARKSGSSACMGRRRSMCARNRAPMYSWPST